MKSYAVDSVYAFIIFVVAFLILPFFVPYEEEGGVSAPLGEYSIEEEEKPEVFTRVIDRVSSFYRLKRGKKPSVKTALPKETEKGELSSLKKRDSAKNKKNGKNGGKNSADKDSFDDREDSAQGRLAGRTSPKRNLPDMAEFNGKLYEIMPDYYGNKYVMTEGGPVPLKSFLANGGRVVKPVYGSGDEHADGAKALYASAAYPSYTRSASSKSGEGRIEDVSAQKGFRQGKITGFSNARASLSSAEGDGSGSSSGGSGKNKFSVGPYDFNSDGGGFDELKGALKSSSGGASGSKEEDAAARRPKVYKLQNVKPILTKNSVGVSDIKKETAKEMTETQSEEQDWDFEDAPEPAESAPQQETPLPENALIRRIGGGASPAGFIPGDPATRRAMSKEILGDVPFIGRAGKENILVPDPWILPNSVGQTPGESFFNANNGILETSVLNKSDWTDSDKQYSQNKAEIAASTNGDVTPFVMINGQKDPYTMITMPENSYYYQVTANLLNNNVRNVDNEGSVDLNKIDRNKTLVVVPEKPLADNLRKDGYKVALFERYIVTPNNLNNFYKQTSSAVNEIETAKNAELEDKKKNIALSFIN